MTIQPGIRAAGANRTTLQEVRVADLKMLADESRRYSKRESELARDALKRWPDGAPFPVIINGELEILDGLEFVAAAKDLGFDRILVVQHEGLTPVEQRQFRVAVDQLQSRGSWDSNSLEAWVRLFEHDIENFDHGMLGFDNGELDKILGIPDRVTGEEDALPPTGKAVATLGSLWALGGHRLVVGDATGTEDFKRLMGGKLADMAITDPPFGCPVDGFVAKKGKHRDFVEGAGDKTPEQLREFFGAFASNLALSLRPGALAYAFIDWRSQLLLQHAFESVFGSLIQMVCWSKDRGGMGGLYRSQHELVFVYRNPGAKHLNAVQLGKHGRNRSNVWDYPCAASSRSGREGDLLKHHPTPKPVEMIADAILDCTRHGDVVIDCFLGSGTTLIAAERTGRCCFGIELDPLYADLAIRRWQNWTGEQAVELESGQTFGELEQADRVEEATSDER